MVFSSSHNQSSSFATEDQLYVALPVRGSREPLLVHQGPIAPGNARLLMDRLVVPRVDTGQSGDLQQKDQTLKRRVSDLQQKDQTFGRMADLVDGIVNVDGSPIFVVKTGSTDVPGIPVRLGEWLRRCLPSRSSPTRRKKSPLGSENGGKSVDELLADGTPEDILTQYKIRATVGLR